MTTSIFSDSWCGIIFDGRNQQYGAYELRKSNERNTLLAILLSVSFLSVGLNVILLDNDPKGNSIAAINEKEQEDSVRTFEVFDLPPPPEDEPIASLPPDKPMIIPPTNTIEFTIPEIVDDGLVVDAVPTQEAFENAQAGATTQTADSTAMAYIGETTSAGQTGSNANTIHGWVEIMPEFYGGEAALMQFIKTNTVYPDIARENGLEGTAYIQFVVDRDGSLTDVTVGKGTFKCLNDEAMRVVKSMPKWKPGKQNGEAVRVRFAIPIRFSF